MDVYGTATIDSGFDVNWGTTVHNSGSLTTSETFKTWTLDIGDSGTLTQGGTVANTGTFTIEDNSNDTEIYRGAFTNSGSGFLEVGEDPFKQTMILTGVSGDISTFTSNSTSQGTYTFDGDGVTINSFGKVELNTGTMVTSGAPDFFVYDTDGSNPGELSIGTNGQLEAGTLAVGDDSTEGGIVTNNGTITASSTVVGVNLYEDATFTNNGAITNGATVQITDGLTAATFNNNNGATINTTHLYTESGTFNNNAGGTITTTSGNFGVYDGSTFNNMGDLNVKALFVGYSTPSLQDGGTLNNTVAGDITTAATSGFQVYKGTLNNTSTTNGIDIGDDMGILLIDYLMKNF